MVESLSQESIKKLEALFGSELPHSFKTFLEIVHQGLGSYHINCPPPNEGAVMSVHCFGFREGSNIIEMTKALREYSRIPAFFVPFANDNEFFFFLDLSDPNGRIVCAYCMQETPEQNFEFIEMPFDSVEEIAINIEDFVNKMQRGW